MNLLCPMQALTWAGMRMKIGNRICGIPHTSAIVPDLQAIRSYPCQNSASGKSPVISSNAVYGPGDEAFETGGNDSSSSKLGSAITPDCRPYIRESVELIGNDGNCHCAAAFVYRRSASPERRHVGSGAAIGVFAVGTMGRW
jgi:hypothetical protein